MTLRQVTYHSPYGRQVAGLSSTMRDWVGRTAIGPVGSHRLFRLTIRHRDYVLNARAQPGWFVVRIQTRSNVRIERFLEPWERAEWLEPLPRVRYLLLESGPTWAAWPMDEEPPSEPMTFQEIELVEHGQVGDVVYARREASGTAWYEEHDRNADPLIAEAIRDALLQDHIPWETLGEIAPIERAALTLLHPHWEEHRQRYAAQRQEEAIRAQEIFAIVEGTVSNQEELATTFREAVTELASPLTRRSMRRWAKRRWAESSQALIKLALALGGARTLAINGTYDSPCLTVEWRRGDSEGTVQLDRQLNLVNAGFCLSGYDAQFDLASLISVALRLDH